MGYYDTHVPKVILRNILENPAWYTAYTPYQAEIAQGRLEALINFQTMVSDLTGMELANASLLDEGTAAAEAMSMFLGQRKGVKKKNAFTFFVSELCHPQTIEVLKTRANPIGVNIEVGDHNSLDVTDPELYGMLLQYPGTDGSVENYSSIIEAAHENNVSKFIFLGSSCIYPKFAPQPLKEEYLLTDSLEPTNEWYAIAKISGVKLIEALRKEYNRDYVSLMPTNLYGPNDNYDLKTSHVLPAMIRKFHEAKEAGNTPVKLWGSGTPMREFLYVDDLGKAVLHALENSLDEHLYNIGTGVDLTIKSLAELIQEAVGHKGDIIWDSSKPDGTPRKLMDNSKMESQGWKAQVNLEQGVSLAYQWFLDNVSSYREVGI